MRRLSKVAGAVLSVAVGAAACGGGAATTSTATAASGPVKIGMIASLTGNYAPLGTSGRQGAELAVAQINSAGGVLGGRKLDLVVDNDQTQPAQSVIDFTDLVGQGVAAVVGSSFSNSGLATEPAAERAQIPYVSAGAADQQVHPVRPYIFMAPATAAAVAQRLLEYFQATGMTRMAVAYDSANAFALTGWNDMKAMAPRYGISFVDTEPFETSTTNFSSVLTHVGSSGAAGLMVWATGAPAVILTKQFAAAGVHMKLVMSHAEASTLYLKPTGAAANGVVVASSIGVVGPELPASRVKNVVLAMAGPFQQAYGYYPSQFAIDAYSAVKLIAAAIDRAGSAAPAKIQQALNTLSLLTPDGRYTYSSTDHSGLSAQDVSIDVVRNGTFVPTPWSNQQLSKTFG